MKKYDLISYAIDFVSFMTKNLDMDSIKSIILFGSAARLEADKNSDIDIFVDVIRPNKEIENKITKIKEDYFDSVKYKNYWKLFGIENEINPMVGNLDEWDLKKSIAANGIILYGKYHKPIKGNDMVLFVWENVKPNSKRVLLNKRLFGYNKDKKRYDGLMQKYKATKLGKGCIIVDSEFYTNFMGLFRKMKITVKMRRVNDYS